MIYAAANDGMLHAFYAGAISVTGTPPDTVTTIDATGGREAWAERMAFRRPDGTVGGDDGQVRASADDPLDTLTGKPQPTAKNRGRRGSDTGQGSLFG